MKAEFYYNKRKYTCCIVTTDLFKELRIRNERGEVLAIEQGKKVGLKGKKRESSKLVNVSQPYFYNLIKAAVSALEMAEKNQLLIEKDGVIERQNEQINILNQQINIINQQSSLSFEQEQQLGKLQTVLEEQKAIAEEQKQRIIQLEDELGQLPQILPLPEIGKKVIAKLGEKIWTCLHPASQRDLCNAYRFYQLIKSDDFAGQVADYSTAGHPLGLVAEREIIAPFFTNLYQFLSINNKQKNLLSNSTFEVGGVILKSDSKHKLGDLRDLISNNCKTFVKNKLTHENAQNSNSLYHIVDCGNRVNLTEQQLIKQFLHQWQHPLSQWLAQGQAAASMIDQIRLLRNRASHAETTPNENENILYLWQFKILWSLLVGSKTQRGVLQEIYSSSNNFRNIQESTEGATYLTPPPCASVGSLSY